MCAPLSPEPAGALTAVSALRPEGDRATAAGASVAARELAAAPSGPREIVIFTAGADASGTSVEQLSGDIVRAGAVPYVVQAGTDDFWTDVVDRTGGAVLPSRTDQVAASYRNLANALEDQYLVAFEAPVALPAVAAVGVGTDDAASSRTLVRLPDPGAATQDPESAGAADRWGPILLLLLGLVLVVMLGLALVRARRRVVPAATPGGPESPVSTSSVSKSQMSESPGSESSASEPLFDGGSRSLGSQPPLAALLSREDSPAGPSVPPTDKPSLPSREDASAAPSASPTDKPPLSAEEEPADPVALRGVGNGVVTLRKRDRRPGPAAVHITGNDEARFFGVRTLGSDRSVLNTIDPYDGVRSLDWDGVESTGFEVRATGSWTIVVMPVAAAPAFDATFAGSGDMVVRYTGGGSTARISGNEHGRYFSVRALHADAAVRLVNTTEAYSGSCAIARGPQVFAVEAVGSWTISIT